MNEIYSKWWLCLFTSSLMKCMHFGTEIDWSFDVLSSFQALGIHEALENENQIRREYSNGSDILYSLEDLQLGAKGDLTKLIQGRRFELILGGEGGSRFSFRAVLLDAREDSGPFAYNCGVFIVPKVCFCILIWFVCASYGTFLHIKQHYKNQIAFEPWLPINWNLQLFWISLIEDISIYWNIQ